MQNNKPMQKLLLELYLWEEPLSGNEKGNEIAGGNHYVPCDAPLKEI